ncbi:MAG TPA: hypothetical protein VFN61_10765 [Acidimicrobiales bacterium]|nr:hypothetical protein [Acidimicrobiales bacterium]
MASQAVGRLSQRVAKLLQPRRHLCALACQAETYGIRIADEEVVRSTSTPYGFAIE